MKYITLYAGAAGMLHRKRKFTIKKLSFCNTCIEVSTLPVEKYYDPETNLPSGTTPLQKKFVSKLTL